MKSPLSFDVENELCFTCSSPCTVRFRNSPAGNLLSDGVFAYTWDADNRLVTAMPIAPTNGSKRVRNACDRRSRRVEKSVDAWDATTESWIPSETRRYVYDEWNPVLETVVTYGAVGSDGSTGSGSDGEPENGSGVSIPATTNRIAYLWGPDLSGSLQGAGGVGGLLAVRRDGETYALVYGDLGNVAAYVSSSGAIAAAYAYDAFGRVLAASGPLADAFPHRFATKPRDPETGLDYYGYRFHSPDLCRWLNRDPIEDLNNVNYYEFNSNASISVFDISGKAIANTSFPDPRKVKPTVKEYGKSNTEYDIDAHCWCRCSSNEVLGVIWSLVCDISFTPNMTLSKSQAAAYGTDSRGIYGHEQRHIQSRTKIVEQYVVPYIASVQPTNYASKGDCVTRATSVEGVLFDRLIFYLKTGNNHVGGGSPFENDLSPENKVGYPPLDGSEEWEELK